MSATDDRYNQAQPSAPLRRFLSGLCLGISMAAASISATAAPILDTRVEARPTAEFLQQDSFGRDTPRSTVQGFLNALAAGDNALADKYLDDDLTSKKKHDSDLLIKTFEHNLNVAGHLLPALQLSDSPDGNRDDLMPKDKDKVGEIDLGDGKHLDIILVQKKSKDGTIHWQFSKNTLKQLPKITHIDPTLMQALSVKKFADVTVFGHNLADMVALIALIVISVMLCYVAIGLIFLLFKFFYPLLCRRPFKVTSKVIMPLTLVVVAIFLSDIMLLSGVPVTLRAPMERLSKSVAWIATAWLAIRLIDVVFERAKQLSMSRNRPEQVSLLGLSKKLAKAFMLIVAVIIIFGNLGFDLTTGIAALGVGGLALAFGAQKTIENLIGSVVVVADRPVNIGDYCKFGTYEGVVIDIGIRSTRVRTLNRTVVTIPNGDFSSLQIENYATRDMFYFLHNLYVQRQTSLDKLQTLLDELTQFLQGHADVNDEWTQVRISQLRQDCYVVELRAYIISKNVVDFYDKQSRLLLEILQRTETLGIKHALPTQAVHVVQDANQDKGNDLPNLPTQLN